MECGDCPYDFYPGERLVVHSTNIYWALLLNARLFHTSLGFPGFSEGKESACNVGDVGSIPGSGRAPGKGMATPVFLTREFHGQRTLAGYSPWGCKEFDTTEQLTLQALVYSFTFIKWLNKISKISPLLDLQEKTCKSVGKFRLRSPSINISFVAGICYLAQETESKSMPSFHFYDMIHSFA